MGSLDSFASFIVRPLVDAAKFLLPAMVGGWLDRLTASPTAVLALLVAIVTTFNGAISWKAASRIAPHRSRGCALSRIGRNGSGRAAHARCWHPVARPGNAPEL